jgi:hypothetical protein
MQPIEDKWRDTDSFDPCGPKEQNEGTSGRTRQPRRLHTKEEVKMLLHLNDEQVQFLINTRQITRILIAGEERFDSRDIDQLIDAYKATAKRRAQ